MNILITGAGGFVGSYLYNNIKFEKVYGQYNNKLNFKIYNKNDLIKLNFLKKEKIKKKIKIDTIIHCASKSPYHGNNFENYKKNIKITKNLIYLMKSFNIKKIIFLSSNSVYENINSNKINEKSFSSKTNFYAKSKLMCEKLLSTYSKNSDIDLIILRLPGIVGQNAQNSFLPKIAKAFKFNSDLILSNYNMKFNNLIHIKNLNTIIKKILLSKIKSNIFNISSKNPIKLISIIKIFEKYYKKKIKIKKKKVKIKKFIIDSKKIKKIPINLPTVKNVVVDYIKDIKIN
jgi:nucleoside-diphosphate-sugar epimerase